MDRAMGIEPTSTAR